VILGREVREGDKEIHQSAAFGLEYFVLARCDGLFGVFLSTMFLDRAAISAIARSLRWKLKSV
jgi:hypothetical protein